MLETREQTPGVDRFLHPEVYPATAGFLKFEGISMYEVRARIAEMPWRCRQLVETGGRRIKSDLW